MTTISRRTALKLSGAAACAPLLPRAGFADQGSRAHGIAVIGDLKYGADFQHFDYVNTTAPHGGRIVTQLSAMGLQPEPAVPSTRCTSMSRAATAPPAWPLTFASLMAGSTDEPGSVYGFVAKEVEISDDRKALRFFLRPEATFHDGSPLTADDVAFSLAILRDKGHPNIAARAPRHRRHQCRGRAHDRRSG